MSSKPARRSNAASIALLQILPGGVRYFDSNGLPSEAVFREPSIAGGVFVTPAVFASDSVHASGERITVDAGVRFDHSRAISPDLPMVSADGRETDAVMSGVGTLYTRNVVSPRLGLTAKLDRDGPDRVARQLRAVQSGVLTGELDPISQGSRTTTTMAYEAATGGYTRLVSSLDPKIEHCARSRDAHATDGRVLAGDRSRDRQRLAASAAYIRKRGTRLHRVDRNDRRVPGQTTLTVDGRRLPVYDLTSVASDRRFFLTNPDSSVCRHTTVWSSRWRSGDRTSGRRSGSYTYLPRGYGLQVMSNGAAEDPQFSTIARAGFLTFGQDPNDLTNATGRLPNDRPHVLRAASVVRLPWHGIQLAANLQKFSGKPWTATTQQPLKQGGRRILIEPRGTRRLSSQSLLDVRVSKTLPVGAAGSIDLIFDVLNLLGDNAEESVVSDNSSSATFGAPRLFIDPRRAMLGVRLNLGR